MMTQPPTLPRAFELPRGSFFLFGPRGTGKTTWLRSALPDAVMVDLLDMNTYRDCVARPERLRDFVEEAPPGGDVVVDEIQRVPNMLNVVHQLMESGGNYRFVLTGSSARSLRRRGVNLLGGRAYNCTMHPFMAAELQEGGAPGGFNLDESLTLGTVPSVVFAEEPERALRAYASVYVEQEVKAEALVRNVGQFSRFLEVVAFSHGAALNVSALAREAQIPRTSAEGYLELLDDLLLAFQLPVFTRRAKRRLVARPKFYYFDCGLYRSLRRAGPRDRSEEVRGPALEGLVAQHLRAWIAYSGTNDRLYYWRTRGGSEVDFVLYGESGTWGLEVKHGTRVGTRHLRGLKSFGDEHPEAQRILLYRGDDRFLRDDIRCLPVTDFLTRLKPGHSLAEAAGITA